MVFGESSGKGKMQELGKSKISNPSCLASQDSQSFINAKPSHNIDQPNPFRHCLHLLNTKNLTSEAVFVVHIVALPPGIFSVRSEGGLGIVEQGIHVLLIAVLVITSDFLELHKARNCRVFHGCIEKAQFFGRRLRMSAMKRKRDMLMNIVSL
ncbi:hypothetical protein L218DRAFT_557620 [Marasmius fiardii PR-910]|nr:hypothetical protein L218DRAFT_557620 [Marasmius fiardii PR-910]